MSLLSNRWMRSIETEKSITFALTINQIKHESIHSTYGKIDLYKLLLNFVFKWLRIETPLRVRPRERAQFGEENNLGPDAR